MLKVSKEDIKKFSEETWWKIEDLFIGVKKFFESVSRVIYFFPVIWNDRDWDFYYLVALVEHKLKSMRKYFAEGDITTRETYSKMISGIEDTLEHIKKYTESTEYYDIECGGCPIDTCHSASEPNEKGYFRIEILNSETGKPLTDEEDKIYSDYLKGSYEFERREWEAIWESIKKEGESWWD